MLLLLIVLVVRCGVMVCVIVYGYFVVDSLVAYSVWLR